MGIKAKVRPYKYKNARYAIRNFSQEDLSNIIREFENFPMNVMRGRGLSMSLPTVTFT